MSRQTLIVVALVVLLFFFVSRKVIQVLDQGEIIGPVTKPDAAGVVRTQPAELLSAANAELRAAGLPELSLDEYALARCLQSEHGLESDAVRTWVAWAVRNAAGSGGLFSKLCRSGNNPLFKGMFAEQRADVRYAATHLSPRAVNCTIARNVCRAWVGADPTKGATNFFSPATMDYGHKQYLAGNPRFAKYTRDAAGVRADWAKKYNLVSIGAPPGTPPGKVEFFAPKKKATAAVS